MEHRQNENHAGYAENIGLDAYCNSTKRSTLVTPFREAPAK